MTMVMIETTLAQEDPERVLSGSCAACGGGVGGDGALIRLSLRTLCVCTWSPLRREAAQLSHRKVRI